MKPIKPGALKLRAEAAADYDVIAACLQDALMPLSEMTFRPEERRFIAVFDRFMWEHCAPASVNRRPPFTIQTALRVEGVTAVRVRGIEQSQQKLILELLTIVPEPGAVSLMFAGGGALRLEGETLIAVCEDLSEPRRTVVAPQHVDESPESDRAS